MSVGLSADNVIFAHVFVQVLYAEFKCDLDVSVGLSAENSIFAFVFCVGFKRLIEMLLVCLWGCLQRL